MRARLRLNVGMKSSEQHQGPLSVGAAAARFGLAPHVLRHWEAVGLLAPARDPAGRRRYGAADLVRIAVVLRAKEAGLPLDTIRLLTATADPARRREVIRDKAAALRARIAAARASVDLLECALACDHEDITRCPHFQRVVADRVSLPDPAPHPPSEP
jgi:DNA-binding transcriptional MerR regulator